MKIFQILMGIATLAASMCHAQMTRVTNDGVVITWETPEPKTRHEEPQEIKQCRKIWPDAHFRCENKGDTNSWQCLVIPHPKVIVLSDVLELRKAILDCGWKPTTATSLPPKAVPPQYQSASEQFSKDDRVLWFSYAEDGIKLKNHRHETN